MCLHTCVGTEEVLDLFSARDPLDELVEVYQPGFIFIDDLELSVRKFGNADPAGSGQADHLSKTCDSRNKELTTFRSVE